MQTLPTEDIDVNAIYLVPIADPQTSDNYAEYIYLDGVWEKLGETPIEIDLTDYVKNTDYATSNKGGVVKASTTYGVTMYEGNLIGNPSQYSTYQNASQNLIISKGTLENVITGKGLVSDTDYAAYEKAGVIKTVSTNGLSMSGSGYLRGSDRTYSQYQNDSTTLLVDKGTLENVITGKGLVSNTDYATSSTAGVVQMSNANAIRMGATSHVLEAMTKTYIEYNDMANVGFIGKGTLENVLAEYYKKQVVLTQTQYDQITPDANTLYIITGA